MRTRTRASEIGLSTWSLLFKVAVQSILTAIRSVVYQNHTTRFADHKKNTRDAELFIQHPVRGGADLLIEDQLQS
jgi:hypothetical protein